MGDVGSELEELAGEKPRPAPKDGDKTSDQEIDELSEKQDTRGTEQHLEEREQKPRDSEQKPPEGEQDASRMNNRDLRKAYETEKKKVREELQPKISKLEARVKELETTGPPKEDPAQVERYKQIEARNKELEQEITFVNYEKSEDYQKNYWGPYVKAWENCRRDIKELTVEAKDAAGNFVERPATEDDVMTLASLPLGEARKRCNALFGDSADDVMFHVREIRKLSDAQQTALAQARKNAANRSQELIKQNQEMNGTRVRVFNESNQQLAEKFPRWFKPIEGDNAGNARLSSGEALVKLMFNSREVTADDVKLLPKSFREEMEAKGRLSTESEVRLHALVRSKAMNHDRAIFQANELRKKVAELEKALKQYEESEPPLGGSERRRGAPALGDESDAFAELDQLAAKGR